MPWRWSAPAAARSAARAAAAGPTWRRPAAPMATRPRRRWPRSLRPWRHNGGRARGPVMTSDSLQHRLAVALEGGDHRGWLGRIIAWFLVALILVNIVD